MVSDSLKLMESLADKDSGNQMEICRNIKYSLKTMPFLLDGIREYIAEHEDKELARKFVGLYSDTKRLHNLCSKHADLNKAAFRTGMAYMSMEVIAQSHDTHGGHRLHRRHTCRHTEMCKGFRRE